MNCPEVKAIHCIIDMKQIFNIVKINTSMDHGVGNRYREWEWIDNEDLIPGYVFDIYGHDLTIVSVDEDEMEFTYRGKTFRINRYWQVLGTPQYGVQGEYIPQQERYIFHFSRSKEDICDWTEKHVTDLVIRMNGNNDEGQIWKNIPLLREIIHEFKDVAPFRSEDVNPACKAHYISCILKNDYLVKTDTPRLFQSLCELYRLYIDFGLSEDYDEDLNKEFDKYYFRNVDEWIYHLAWIMDDPASGYAQECWDWFGKMLKVDIVQATPEWEDVIYEVEKEVEEELKDEPRGMGFCFGYWSAKRAALERRGIQWRSPSSMNPRVMFD